VFVAGVSPRRALDDRYRDFFELAADHIATAISNAVALQDAKRRAEALAEIDRAKTAFFSNVSHEFRTPLTLMLGPTEAALASPDEALRSADLRMVYRNQMRLLKLVNALLDFSRIEAGRATASYQRTDLSALTRELCGAFQSTIEHAGLRFEVSCEPIDAAAYVDRDMWEKIILNLLSNAFKFTFDGGIRVSLRERGPRIELAVEDTGTGIPEAELTRVFERFHRIEGARSRTHEGSGIGLALTSELVRLHGGTIEVTSRIGVGSTFTVTIPTGSAHLPADRIDAEPALASTAVRAAAFIEEARRWLPHAEDGAMPDSPAPGAATVPAVGRIRRRRILIADDNADMRDYLASLLREWDVCTAVNGRDALERVREVRPDLVVTDVMMPDIYGFGLLDALRADSHTSDIPVMMLSARSGEDARVAGLTAGADDYVIKPFSARELQARVRSLLALSEARREAELQKRHLHSLFMQAPTPILILRGADHVIELANEMTCRVWGRKEREVVGKPLLEAIPELQGQPFKELLDGVLRTGVPYIGRETPARLDRGDGWLDTVFFNFVYAPLRGIDADIEGILVIAFDVTAEVKAREEMNGLRAAEQAANRTKDEFLAMLGHELRNPLSPILTALQLMSLRGDHATERERTVIERQVRHLVRLVDDLLDVSRIAQGKIELRRRPVNIADVIAAAVEGTTPLFEERQQRLEVDIEEPALMVYGDSTRLTQIVTNLLSNAAKYTDPRGTVHLTARRADNQVEMRVRDTGIGIAPELLPFIFDMFTQGRQRSDRALGGLGLGLTIVRSMVSQHDGTVEARSEGQGKGSEFIVRLPLFVAEQHARSRAVAQTNGLTPALLRRRILVVDDNVDAAGLTAAALDTLGHETRMAFDGPGALSAASTFQPDIVLLDLGLPLMDGYEVARQLRNGATTKIPLIIAVTGYGQASDFQRTETAGFHGHMVKPVDVQELAMLLDRLSAQTDASKAS
jgi:PAS domain S-box-containing protein